MKRALLIFTVSLLSTTIAKSDGLLLIGAAEERIWNENSPGIRVMFAKQGGEWIVFNSISEHRQLINQTIDWTIAFDGRNLGQLTTSESNLNLNENDIYSRRIFSYKIDNPAKFPRISNSGGRFATWSNVPEYRPIVVVNKPNYKDPESWKRFHPPHSEINILIPPFTSRFGDIKQCNGRPNWDTTPVKATVDDFNITRAYINNKNEKLYQISIIKKHYDKCDGIVDDMYYSMWFYVSDTETEFVGTRLDLVDAGDYDNDGKVEFVFTFSGYNEDGYVLFESGFKSFYTYNWKYH